MKSHDPKRISDAQARHQYWRAFVYVMHLHENRCIKRAGVAGLRARAVCFINDLEV
jgi:metal-responsive CopG/Arc/MetJ family transcriptional regulator